VFTVRSAGRGRAVAAHVDVRANLQLGQLAIDQLCPRGIGEQIAYAIFGDELSLAVTPASARP
jgi:hypothetical protein